MTSEEWTEEPRKNQTSLEPVHWEVKGRVLRAWWGPVSAGRMDPGVWEEQRFQQPFVSPPLCSSSEVDGEMWCYQKPGFEALLLAELQRQQQRSQFCDTLLKAEGVSVPAHSCLLSAISPLVSSTLSSTPAPPAGESRLVEFQALDACTLLRMVRLLYSGEMAGEGEKEKQVAISAAANLGIHGLVEVTSRDPKSSDEEGEGRLVEVGVQTEPMMLEDYKKKRVKWRREVRDGCTLLWKETHTYSEKDMWTQTEQTAPSTPSATSIDTMDMAALHNAEQTDAQSLPFQVPHIPISLLYLPENQINQPPSASATSMQDSTAAEPTSGALPTFCPVPLSLQPFSTLSVRDAAEGEEWLDQQFERFQGNIPGFINNFLNPDKGEGGGRGRAGRKRGAGSGRPRRAGAAERRAGRPRGSTGGRWRGKLTQTVDVQKVGVSKVQKLFLQRWGRRSSRTGQGGGAAGRKLCLKTREFLRSAKSYRRSRSRGKVLEFSQSEEMLPHSQAGGEGSTQHGQTTPGQKVNQDGRPASGTRSSRAKSTTSYSITPVHFYNIDTLSSPHLQPPPSPAASFMPPASSLLHTTCLPAPELPPLEEQPEQIDRLLEEAMSGLDILPKSSSFPGSRHPRPTRGSSCTYVSSGNSSAQNKAQVCTTGLLEAFHGSAQVTAVTCEASTPSSARGEVPVLQLQGEGEMNHMLEHFLHSFEQHVENCRAREEEETNGEISTEPSKSNPNPVLNNHRKTKTKTKRPVIRPQTESQPGRSQPQEGSDHCPAPLQRAEETSGNHRTQRKRVYKKKKKQHLLSLEKRRVRRKPVPMSDAEIKILHGLGDKRLQQIPVVKLERRGPIPVRVTLQAYSCQRQEVKDSGPLLYKTLVDKPTSAGSSRGRSKEIGQHVGLPLDGSSTPVERFATNEQLEENQERHEVELTVGPQEEGKEPKRRGEKRRAESGGGTRDDATAAKRICFEPVTDPTCETCIHSSGSANLLSEQADTEAEEVIDVESVSLTSVGEIKEEEETEEGSMYEEAESSADEIIDVDGDTDGGSDLENDPGGCREEAGKGRTLPFLSHCVSTPSAQEGGTGLTGSREDEDINVVGDYSPSLSR